MGDAPHAHKRSISDDAVVASDETIASMIIYEVAALHFRFYSRQVAKQDFPCVHVKISLMQADQRFEVNLQSKGKAVFAVVRVKQAGMGPVGAAVCCALTVFGLTPHLT